MSFSFGQLYRISCNGILTVPLMRLQWVPAMQRPEFRRWKQRAEQVPWGVETFSYRRLSNDAEESVECSSLLTRVHIYAPGSR